MRVRVQNIKIGTVAWDMDIIKNETTYVNFKDAPFKYKRIYALKKRFNDYFYRDFKSFIKKNDPKHLDICTDWHPWDKITDIIDYNKFNYNMDTYVSNGGFGECSYYLNLKNGVLCKSGGYGVRDEYFKYDKKTGKFKNRYEW